MRPQVILTLLLASLSSYSAETEFILEAKEKEEILAIVDTSLRSIPWNGDISTQKSYVYSVDDYSVRVVEIEFAPIHQTSSIKRNYQVSCTMEVDSDVWDCAKELARYVYPSSVAEWVPLLDENLAEEEAIEFLNKISENKVLSWKEQEIEIEFDDLLSMGIALAYDEEFIDVHALHQQFGHIAIEIPRKISGRVTEISRIIEFFIVCDDGSLQYGIDACKQNQ